MKSLQIRNQLKASLLFLMFLSIGLIIGQKVNAQSIHLSYPGGLICATDSVFPDSVFPVPSGSPIDTFYQVSGPGTLVFFDSINGVIDAGATGPGIYTVAYETFPPNPGSTAVSVTITANDDASFSFPSVICDSTGTITPSGVATSGVFSINSSFGNPNDTLVWDGMGYADSSLTGVIDIDSSNPGSYLIVHQTAGTCPSSFAQQILIKAKPQVDLSYATDSLCSRDTLWYNPTITLDGSPLVPAGGDYPGTFSATIPGGLAFNLALGLNNPVSPPGALEEGAYNVDSAGTFFIQYNYQDTDGCTDTSEDTIFVAQSPDPSFSYSQASYCIGTGSTPAAAITGNLGGSFTVSNNMFPINSSTGVIDLANSPPSDSTLVYYMVSGTGPSIGCTSRDSIQVVNLDFEDASFNYIPDTVCQGGDTLFPDTNTIVTPGGTFSETSSTLVFNDVTTGEMDLTAGGFGGSLIIEYTTPGLCPGTSQDTITVLEQDNPEFFYSVGNVQCHSDAPAFPTLAGLGGGAFRLDSGTGFGVVLDSTSGKLSPYLSDTGTYYISYTTKGTCPGTDVDTITILPRDTADFSYPSNDYCKSQGIAVPSFGSVTGTFSEPTGSVSFNSTSSGEIDLVASLSPGPFQIWFITTGCPDTANFTMRIIEDDSANVIYPDSGLYCEQDPYPIPTIVGSSGGVFSITGSNDYPIDPTNGEITLDSVSTTATTPFNVVYSTVSTSTCPTTVTIPVTVYPQGNPAFTYLPEYCQSIPNANPSAVQSNPGDYYVCIVSGGSMPCDSLVMDSTGTIFPAQSVIGTYTVQHFVTGSSGNCPASATTQFSIAPEVNATINYPFTNYCVSDGPSVPSQSGGTTTGSFTANDINNTGSNLNFVNSIDGTIDPQASDPGTYEVQYVIPGVCTNSARDTITIDSLDNANFSFSSPNFCEGDPDPIANITGLQGGLFTANSTRVVFVDSIFGVIDMDSSRNGGPYTITYSTNGQCPNFSTQQITIGRTPAPILESDQGLVICEGTEVHFDATSVITGTGIISFTWYVNDTSLTKSGNNFFEPHNLLPNPYTLQDGDEVKVFAQFSPSQGGCFGSDSLVMNVNPIPFLTLTQPPGTITADDPIVLDLGTNADNTKFHYEILVTGNTIQSEIIDSTQFINAGQTFPLTPTINFLDDITPARLQFYIQPVANGCIGNLDSLSININPPNIPVFVPGVITPNGDGRNDVWQIQFEEGLLPADYKVEVYNRSGGLAWELDQLVDPMTWSGEGLPDGVYWYILYDNTTGSAILTGGLTIRRKKTGLPR